MAEIQLPMSELKRLARAEARERLRNISVESETHGSRRVAEVIACQSFWGKARVVMFYACMRGEPNVWTLAERAWDEGKRVCFPRFAGDVYEAALVERGGGDMVSGRFGILEPRPDCVAIPGKQLDLVLIPGLAWTRCGLRLGRGKGFYDRLLSACSGIHCGVAFGEQIVETLPVEPHDRRVAYLATPEGCERCRSTEAD